MTKERMKQLVSISYPAGMESFIFQFGMLAFFWIVALYGTNAVAAYNIGTNVLMLSFTVGMGFAIVAYWEELGRGMGIGVEVGRFNSCLSSYYNCFWVPGL